MTETEEVAAATAPRRSSRLSSQPQVVNQKADSAGSKKRGTDGSKVSTTKNKKAKTSEPQGEITQGGSNEGEDRSSTIVAEPTRIEIGDTLPSVILQNEKGEDVDVSTIASERGVVLFLVPKADTPGCTKQACAFGDIYTEITSANFDVYCLSADAPAAQSRWQSKRSLPYSLLSDQNRVLISALGAGEGGKTTRSHFVFTKGGKLVDKKIPVKPLDSPKMALECIKSLG